MPRHHSPLAGPRLALSCCLALAGPLAGPLVAQADGPPWWGVADNDTVSLYWSFDNAAAPFAPTAQVVPAWFTLPPNGGFTVSSNVTWLPSLNGQTGVVGFQGAGTGTLSLLVDNDPRYDWIKIFFFQFDALATGSADLVGAIRQDLTKYDRAIVSESSVPLANGWVRTTVHAQLIPQPVDETIDFTLTGAALQSVAIDNLFVNSKCVKPPPDPGGDASGETDAAFGIDLNARTGNADCTAAAAHEDQNGVLQVFVAGVSASALPHEVFVLDASGAVTATVPTNVTPQQSLRGITDLAVARLLGPGGVRLPTVFGVVDRRSPLGGGDVLLLALDPTTQPPTLAPARSISIPQAQFPAGAQSPFGLAFFPPGNGGNGTFWISEQGGEVYEYSRQGALLRTLTPAANNTPQGIGGAAYDELTGRFYWFGSSPTPSPAGVLQVNGVEHSAYDFQPTGNVFYGDLRLPGARPGGVARGCELLRRGNGDFRLFCVTRNAGVSRLSVLKGPFPFGWNLAGRIRMGSRPFQGSPFRVDLTGVPRATAAVLYAGFNNTQFQGQTLPFNLGPIGLDESNISVALHANGPVSLVQNGTASTVIPLPASGLGYVPLFFQWVVFDTTVPNGLATSQAGKTVIY